MITSLLPLLLLLLLQLETRYELRCSPHVKPKSATLPVALRSSLFTMTMTLPALISRCTLPFSCMHLSPHAASYRILQWFGTSTRRCMPLEGRVQAVVIQGHQNLLLSSAAQVAGKCLPRAT